MYHHTCCLPVQPRALCWLLPTRLSPLCHAHLRVYDSPPPLFTISCKNHLNPSHSQVVALGEPAWYAYRDVAPEAGHYKVRIDYTNARKAAEMTPATRVRDGGAKPSGRRWWWPWGGSSGKEKQQKGAAAEEDEDDDSTAIWYIKK